MGGKFSKDNVGLKTGSMYDSMRAAVGDVKDILFKLGEIESSIQAQIISSRIDPLIQTEVYYNTISKLDDISYDSMTYKKDFNKLLSLGPNFICNNIGKIIGDKIGTVLIDVVEDKYELINKLEILDKLDFRVHGAYSNKDKQGGAIALATGYDSLLEYFNEANLNILETELNVSDKTARCNHMVILTTIKDYDDIMVDMFKIKEKLLADKSYDTVIINNAEFNKLNTIIANSLKLVFINSTFKNLKYISGEVNHKLKKLKYIGEDYKYDHYTNRKEMRIQFINCTRERKYDPLKIFADSTWVEDIDVRGLGVARLKVECACETNIQLDAITLTSDIKEYRGPRRDMIVAKSESHFNTANDVNNIKAKSVEFNSALQVRNKALNTKTNKEHEALLELKRLDFDLFKMYIDTWLIGLSLDNLKLDENWRENTKKDTELWNQYTEEELEKLLKIDAHYSYMQFRTKYLVRAYNGCQGISMNGIEIKDRIKSEDKYN